MLQTYVLRKLIEHKLRTSGIGDDDCYICSLSSRTIVYKGQLTPAQVNNPELSLSLDRSQITGRRACGGGVGWVGGGRGSLRWRRLTTLTIG